MFDTDKVYLITSNSEAGALETLPSFDNLELISSDFLSTNSCFFQQEHKVCITSEASIEIVTGKIDDVRRRAIEALKDKFEFRKLLKGIYPNYNFSIVKAQEIDSLRVSEKSVIKPVKGCFGTAVRVIEPSTNLKLLRAELEIEISKNKSVLSDSVLSKEDFIVEQFIEGEEYAVDMFYNQDGVPCIVNIYHHPMPKNKAYLHMVYYSSKSVFQEVYSKAKEFFARLNTVLSVTNFVMHSEFKMNGGEFVPIEINTMRFGGMGLGNLVFHSLQINPYAFYLQGEEPDWERIWEGKDQDIYAFFIAYNAASKPVNAYKPNISKLKRNFLEVLLEKQFDYQKQLAFAIFCLRETEENLSKLLEIEFDDFFEEI